MTEKNYTVIIVSSEFNDDIMFKIALDNFVYYGDEFVAKKCGLDENDYKILMQRKFNGSIWNDNIIFLKKSDAIKAKDYLQSLLLIRRMANVSD